MSTLLGVISSIKIITYFIMYSIAGVKTEEIEVKIDIDDYFGSFSSSLQEGAETTVKGKTINNKQVPCLPN